MVKMSRKAWLILTSILVIAALGGIGYLYAGDGKGRGGNISASGTIEGNPLVVRTKLPGQVVELDAQEGGQVTKGQIIAKLDAKILNDKVSQAEAQVEASKAQVKSAQAALSLTGGEVAGKISQAEAGVGIAKALLAQAQAGYDLAQKKYADAEKLYNAGALAKSDLTDASLALKAAQGKLEEAQNGVNSAQAVLDQAAAGEISSEAAQQAGAATNRQVEQAEAGFEAARAQQQLAEAALAEANDTLGDTVITSPVDGTITLKAVSSGELVSQGIPLVEITNLNDLHVTVYIPETKVGKVKVGQTARISVDSAPGKSFSGKVDYISSQAEFTPSNVQTAEDRAKLVYAVKIHIDDPQGIMKPGMPADVVLQ